MKIQNLFLVQLSNKAIMIPSGGKFNFFVKWSIEEGLKFFISYYEKY